MTLKGGTSQACAACKYQRKRCTPECALAPHFRPEQTDIFKNAHKLFGVRNILRILKQIDPAQKTEAMRSIIYQANMRDRFPVHGCYGIICQLSFQLRQAEEELHAVLSQLSLYKQQENISSLTPNDTSTSQQLQLGMGMVQPANAALTLFQQDTTTVTVPPQEQLQLQFNPVEALPISSFHTYSNTGNGNGNGGHNNCAGYIDSKEHVNVANALWGQQQAYCNGNNENKALMSLQSQLVNSQTLNIQEEEEANQDYDEIHPFFDTIDDRQSYIDSKEAYESSSDSSPKDTTQSLEHVADNELKTAEL